MKNRTTDRKYDMYFILSLLLVIVIVLGLSLLKPEPPVSSGGPHPEIEGMRIGGEGTARIRGFEAAAFILNAGSLLIFAALMVFGISGRYRNRAFWIWTVILTVILLFAGYRVIDGYLDYLSTGRLNFFLGFPSPTAWMIYGIWGAGALFIIFYVVGFRKYIFTREDEAVLRDIAEEYQKEGEE
jgi:hypothetical protein